MESPPGSASPSCGAAPRRTPPTGSSHEPAARRASGSGSPTRRAPQLGLDEWCVRPRARSSRSGSPSSPTHSASLRRAIRAPRSLLAGERSWSIEAALRLGAEVVRIRVRVDAAWRYRYHGLAHSAASRAASRFGALSFQASRSNAVTWVQSGSSSRRISIHPFGPTCGGER